MESTMCLDGCADYSQTLALFFRDSRDLYTHTHTHTCASRVLAMSEKTSEESDLHTKVQVRNISIQNRAWKGNTMLPSY